MWGFFLILFFWELHAASSLFLDAFDNIEDANKSFQAHFLPWAALQIAKINGRWEITIEMPDQYWTEMPQTVSSAQAELPLTTISQTELQDQESSSSDVSLNIYLTVAF